MKLFKFLIIDDSIINECFKPILNDEIYGVHQRKRNRIYKLNTNEDFMIMSFTYPNINSWNRILGLYNIDKSIYRSIEDENSRR